MEMSNMNIALLNKFIKNQKGLYDILVNQKGLYLPNLETKAITDKYLIGVLKGEFFRIERTACKVPPKPTKRVSVPDLIEILEKLSQKTLGFDVLTPPNKEWLVSVIYALDANHDLFAPIHAKEMREIPKNFFENFDYEMISSKGRGFFKRTFEEQVEIKKKRAERKILTLARRSKYLTALEEKNKYSEAKTKKKLEHLVKDSEEQSGVKKKAKKLIHDEKSTAISQE